MERVKEVINGSHYPLKHLISKIETIENRLREKRSVWENKEDFSFNDQSEALLELKKIEEDIYNMKPT